jgi:GAF domain-containing protein
MRCSRCQQENPAGVMFCGECGTPFQRLVESIQPPPSYGDVQRSMTETLEQQTATSEILRVISQSPTDAQPVFDTIVAHALRLCDAPGSGVYRFDGELIHVAALRNIDPAGVDAVRQAYPMPPTRSGATGRAILTRDVVYIRDVGEDPEYQLHSTAAAVGYRSIMSVPMLRGQNAIGAITVNAADVAAFSDNHVKLLQTFADQAVIAIENVRLFTELRASNRELTSALDTQTATSDILRVISSSPTDLQPVFDAIVTSAVRLCDARFANVFRLDGEVVHLVAHHNLPLEALEQFRRTFPQPLSQGGTITAQAMRRRAVVHVHDIELQSDIPVAVRELSRSAGYRSALAMPILRKGSALGAIGVGRSDRTGAPRPFSDKEVELLQTFADQAVIAIENVRLFKELEERTAALTRSVDQLTALGDVGRAVSSSLDLETVLSTIVTRAVGLSGLDDGVVFEYDDGAEEFVQRVATQTGEALAEARRTTRIRKGEGVLGRTAITLEPVHVPDITAPGAYEGRLRETLIDSGIRAILAVPLVREGRLIGCLAVTRKAPGEFDLETVRLLTTFATQSALAIQNARLFREIESKSHQLEVASQHKSEFLANMSHELRTPLNAIIGYSEMLQEEARDLQQDAFIPDLEKINAAAKHQLSLINDILDLSKIEAGRMELELTDFHLPTVIEVSVADTGVGIAPEDQEAVFEEFRQVGTADKKVEGTGLGLALSRRVVELHGGRIWVKSQVGQGSTFTFTLPVDRGE